MKNVIYFSFTELPSQAANSVHIMKMCQAIGMVVNELMLVANVKADSMDDVFGYYGIDRRFSIKSFPILPIRILGRLVYLIVATAFFVRNESEMMFYTRDLYSGFLFTRLGYPIIIECHEAPVGVFSKFLLKRIIGHRNTKLVVCISGKMKNRLNGLFRKAGLKGKIMVAHDGVDSKSFDCLPPKRAIRRALGLPEDRHIVGYAGNLFKGRGIEIIIEVASRIKESLFVIVGGYKSDIDAVVQTAKERGVDNLLLTGHVPNSVIPNYLSAFDLLMMPYQYAVTLRGNKGDTAAYMSPLKMFEYMASGKPILSSKLEVLEEVLENRRNAILVQPDDIQAWCDGIVSLRQDEALGEKIGKQAKLDVQKYNWTERAKNIFGRLQHV